MACVRLRAVNTNASFVYKFFYLFHVYIKKKNSFVHASYVNDAL